MPDVNAQVQAVLDDLVARGVERGLQVAAYRDGQLIVDAWAGVADAETGSPVDGETLFCVFSTSKGITATLIHMLAERGLLDYDAPLTRYWPEFGAHGKDAITVRHVLTHTAGVPHLPPGAGVAQQCDWDWMVHGLEGLAPLWQPGSQAGYHALTYGWLLGEVAHRVTGRSVGQLLQDEICAPLAIDSLFMGIPDAVEPRVARLEAAPAPPPPDDAQSWLAIPHACWPLWEWANRPEVRRATIPAGVGIANARAIARHYAALVGPVDGARLLSAERLALALTPQTPVTNLETGQPAPWALGYAPFGPPSAPGALPPFGHGGAGGSIGYADPAHRIAFALTKNRMVDNPAPGDAAVERVGAALRAALGHA
ncbi:MAG: beta-lactamase family protein [Chloroflexi bacterium]|nr:beta-lactamase family protein [Chloroflexota bacterium]